MDERGFSVAVIGGGIAGLSTAFDLEHIAAGRGIPLQVTLFEARDRVGGNLRTRCEKGYVVEEGPNGFLDKEPATLRLVDRLELRDRLARSADAARRRYLLHRGDPALLPESPAAFLKTRLLSWPAKARVLLEPFVPARRRGPDAPPSGPEADETVYDFGCRRLGRAFAEAFLDPMVKGIFGGDARRLSLEAAFPRMRGLEERYGSLFKALHRISRERKKAGGGKVAPSPGGVLLSFDRGTAVLPARLGARLAGTVLEGCPVESVVLRNETWWIAARGREHGPFHAVVDAAPAHSAARHLPGSRLAELLSGIPFAPMAVVSLAFDRAAVGRPLDGFGLLHPTREGRRLLGVLWSSSIYPGRAPEGKVLLRCMAGGAADPRAVELGDEALVDLCLAEIGPPLRLRGAPERTWITRWERAIAQFVPGHPARLAAIREAMRPYPGLFLAGASYRGVSINHCTAEAEVTARAVAAYLLETGRVSSIPPRVVTEPA